MRVQLLLNTQGTSTYVQRLAAHESIRDWTSEQHVASIRICFIKDISMSLWSVTAALLIVSPIALRVVAYSMTPRDGHFMCCHLFAAY
jgi:hypothetical protein